MREQIEKVKSHLKENKKFYIAVTASAVVSAAAGATGALVLKGRVTQTAAVVQGIAYKSPVTQNVIQQSIPRAGHAGKVFVDRDDPTKVYMSVRLLADALGVTRRDVQQYLAGKIPDLAGRQVDLIMDGAAPLMAELTVKA